MTVSLQYSKLQMLVFHGLLELPGERALGRNLTGLFETAFLPEKALTCDGLRT